MEIRDWLWLVSGCAIIQSSATAPREQAKAVVQPRGNFLYAHQYVSVQFEQGFFTLLALRLE